MDFNLVIRRDEKFEEEKVAGVLFRIPAVKWVHGVIHKMNQAGKQDVGSWEIFWLETYFELGGKSKSSGSKGCPAHGAYGLWQLGRVKGCNLPYQSTPLRIINQTYGKNAAYAAIALDILTETPLISDDDLWWKVQENFYRQIHERPAESQQGAVTVARILFEEGEIITSQV